MWWAVFFTVLFALNLKYVLRDGSWFGWVVTGWSLGMALTHGLLWTVKTLIEGTEASIFRKGRKGDDDVGEGS